MAQVGASLDLLPQHRRLLDASGIAEAVIAARGYRSIEDAAELEDLGYSFNQRRVPCLLIPQYDLHGRQCGHSIRPDDPRLNDDGKPVKYDKPFGSRNRLDVNPIFKRHVIEDTSFPAVLTEGTRKVDAATSERILAVGLSGVWGWVSRESGSSLVIPDFRDLPLEGRMVYVAYDSDAQRNPKVYQASIELGEMIRDKKNPAGLRFVVWPEDLPIDKCGIDDWKGVLGRDIQELLDKHTQDYPVEPDDNRKWIDKYDLYAFAPTHKYIFMPTGDLWVPETVSRRVQPVPLGAGQAEEATRWLDKHRAVEQMTWAPGESKIIDGKLMVEGGWKHHPGARAYNQYDPPPDLEGHPDKAGPWLDHVERIYPGGDARHIVAWFAQRIQRPQQKINHALLLGGVPGIGKDTIVEPVITAVGPGNFADVSPATILGRFNRHFKAVLLRVNELQDLGEGNRFAFLEKMKNPTASPPTTLMIEEKYQNAYYVANVVGVVYTTNHRTDALSLSPDDRRHYVTWSDAQAEEFTPEYFDRLYDWLDNRGGRAHVQAHLRALDVSWFNPSAPPPKTPAFWVIVESNAAPEDTDLVNLIEALGGPGALTIPQLVARADQDRSAYESGTSYTTELGQWLQSRQNARKVTRRLEKVGYVPQRNPYAADGRWNVGKKKTLIYVRSDQSVQQRVHAAEELSGVEK